MRETYWVSLGRSHDTETSTYPQSVLYHKQWVDSAMRDSSVVGLVQIEVDLRTGAASAVLLKNTIDQKEADHD